MSLSRAGFCCKGCETVYSLLRDRGLDDYYRIRASSGAPPRRPVLTEAGSAELQYDYLDQPEFLELYASDSRLPSDSGPDASSATRFYRMRFYLEGAHCAACVWLTEKISEFVPRVASARLDLSSSVMTVELLPGGSFAAVARELARLGYLPHPVRLDEIDSLRLAADHLLLARVAVAGAGAGNIMLLAVSLYAGAEGRLAELFRWASFALCLPVLLFSAFPFYQNAWRAIRAREISIDIPIALGIGIGALSSVFNLLTGSPFIYFDSLSALVFLMLASRYFLRKTQQAAISASRLGHFLTPAAARVIDPVTGVIREKRVEAVRKGDLIETLAFDCVPVDGVVREGRSHLDNSLLTGEFRPSPAQPGDPVFAGMINQRAPLRIEVTASAAATRLARILKSVEDDAAARAPLVAFADRIARIFVAAVLVSVVAVFVYGLRFGLHEATNLALALSIVTCPCAFALATPLAMSLSIGRCARQGCLLKGSEILERLARIEEVVLDKTGTLTTGKLEVLRYAEYLDNGAGGRPDWAAIVALEKRSRHPVARAIVAHFEPLLREPLPEVELFAEEAGRGVAGRVGGHFYELGRWRDEPSRGRPTDGASHQASQVLTRTEICRDGKPIGWISLGDRLRPDSVEAVRKLRALGLRISLLSGDSAEAVGPVADALSIPTSDWQAGLSPEAKRDWVVAHPKSLMVGDGANDANALAAAFVGIAVQGGMEIAMRSADIYHRSPGVLAVAPLVTIARETMKVVRRNFAFSLLYNLAGIAGVLLGWVTPLFAAVLMPLSAATVFASSLAGTRRLRKALRELREEKS